MIKIRRLNVEAIDFRIFLYSCVFWLGAGPIWIGKFSNEPGYTLSFRYKLTPEIYVDLKRHHDEAGDRRLRAEPPPPQDWFLEGIRKGMFCGLPVMPSPRLLKAAA